MAGSDAEGLAVFGVDDGVGFYMLRNAPGEEEGTQLRCCGGTPGDNVEFRFDDAAGVGVLKEQASGDVFDDGLGRGGVDLDETKVLFGCEDGACFGGEGGRGDGFDEELGDF